jgi:hypothetical protein
MMMYVKTNVRARLLEKRAKNRVKSFLKLNPILSNISVSGLNL